MKFIRGYIFLKKGHITLLSILLIIILFIGGITLLKDKNNEHAREKSTEELLEEERQVQTVTHENGDFIYVPASEDIGYDSKEEVFFYENILNLFLVSEISNEQAEELAKTVDGEIVGRIQGAINVLQLQVEGESFAELSQLADRFEEAELVNFAELSTPSFISELSGNGAQKDSKEVKEDQPTGDNWWEEAINAPLAWEYLDKHADEFEKVKVAVLEPGKLGKKGDDIDNDDIKDSIEEMAILDLEEAVFRPHATLVTRFMAAKKDSESFRGIANGVVDINFTSIGGLDITKEVEVADEHGKGVNELLVISNFKSNLEKGVTVFNHSWVFAPWSETKWKEEDWGNKLFNHNMTYKRYLKASEKSNDKVSAQLIYSLDQILNNEEENYDFLIVQGAGNGYTRLKKEEDSKEQAIDATLSGAFVNINEDTYEQAKELTEEKKLGSELDEILNHIIIVGGAVQKNSQYQSPEWASYGNAIDIAAPAEDLIVDGNLEYGTSFATPMVSGAAALIWSYQPDLTAPEVKKLLLSSKKEDVKEKEEKSDKDLYPMLNAGAFLRSGTYYYQTLMETYRTAIIEQWDYHTLLEKDLGPASYHPAPLSSDYGYEFKDINNDGVQEMILGIYIDGKQWIEEIYTLKGEEPVKIFESGLRYRADIYEDGTIKESGSSGGFYFNYFYELDENGKKELKKGFEENAAEGTYNDLTVPYPHKRMEEAKVNEILEEYEGIEVIEHTFIPFVSGEEVK